MEPLSLCFGQPSPAIATAQTGSRPSWLPPSHSPHPLSSQSPAPCLLTSHWLRSPRSSSRDQMLWIRPACSGCLLLSPQEHWCFSITES